MVQSFAAPIWMTFKQAMELDAQIRRGEKGSLVVNADSITLTKRPAPKSTGKSRFSRERPFSTSSRSKICRTFITRKPLCSAN